MTEPLPADDPRHGTTNGYTNLRCRCERCCAAQTAYFRERGTGPYKHDRCPRCGWPKYAVAKLCRECRDAKREAPHGTEARYKRCHCDACRAAAAAGRRKRRHENPNVAVHNANGYANGCRCDECREGSRIRHAERRALGKR